MLLLTGATGFIGRRLLESLMGSEYAIRCLLKPSRHSPRLPRGRSIEITVSSLSDLGGVRASMVGVRTVIHLASAERYGPKADLWQADALGTENLVQAAADAGVERVIFMSHLGADRSSAYPVLRAKAAAEESLRTSGVGYTILRSGVVFGAEDRFTTALAKLSAVLPIVFPLVGQGATFVQPLWLDDLVTTLLWILEEPGSANRTYDLGGPEHISLRECIELVHQRAGMRRWLVPTGAPYLRLLVAVLERLLPNSPVTDYSLDYVAANRTTDLDALPRMIGIQPSRMIDRLGYLSGRHWGRTLLADQRRAGEGQVA